MHVVGVEDGESVLLRLTTGRTDEESQNREEKSRTHGMNLVCCVYQKESWVNRTMTPTRRTNVVRKWECWKEVVLLSFSSSYFLPEEESNQRSLVEIETLHRK
jgi:hypothetical protein